ncbi:MAG: hypothetical protein Q8P24_10925 [Desulfobacterales bacterium]|nr:hypothetical protein [Desulfobacterales bacterium]
MNKPLLTLIFLALCLFPAVCFSSYVIELNNGAIIKISQYWEDGDLIKIYLYGGVVGIQKSFIKKIEQPGIFPLEQLQTGQERPAPQSDTTPKINRAVHDSDPSSSLGPDGSKVTGTTKKNESESQQYQRKISILKDKIDNSLEQFKKASSAKDAAAQKRAMEDISEYSKEIYELQKKIEKPQAK